MPGKGEDFSFCFEGPFHHEFSPDEREEMIQLAASAFEAAHSKLSKYVVDGAQPESKFLEQVQVLDPTNSVGCQRSLGAIDSIPGMESVSKKEWKLYVDHIGPQAVKNAKDEDGLDLKQFWKSKVDSLPELCKQSSCYCITTIGSYDVKRSFSPYAILDGKRRLLEQKTMKAFHFLNWNLRVKSVLQEEKEKVKESKKSTKKQCHEKQGIKETKCSSPQ